MVDPGAVGSDQSQGQNRHWLINGATIVGEFSFHAHRQNSNRFLPDNALNFDNATTITAYAGPAPPSGSGPHRLVDSAAHLPLPRSYPLADTPSLFTVKERISPLHRTFPVLFRV